jgi:hypothetical protein
MYLAKRQWKVKPIGMSATARLIITNHYSGSVGKNFVAIHGLFHVADDYCVLPYGVCWWQPLASPSAARFFSRDWKNVLCLSRLVCTPDAPKNAASFMLSHSIKMLPERYHTLATYADTWQGHTGAIYKATNWDYSGITDDKPIWVNEDGNVISIKNGDNTRTVDEMKSLGYLMIGRHAKHRYSYTRFAPKETVSQLMLAI